MLNLCFYYETALYKEDIYALLLSTPLSERIDFVGGQ